MNSDMWLQRGFPFELQRFLRAMKVFQDVNVRNYNDTHC